MLCAVVRTGRVGNGRRKLRKLPEVAGSRRRSPEVTGGRRKSPDSQKLPKIDKNRQKSPKVAGIVRKCRKWLEKNAKTANMQNFTKKKTPEIKGNCRRWLKNVKCCQKLLKYSKNRLKRRICSNSLFPVATPNKKF